MISLHGTGWTTGAATLTRLQGLAPDNRNLHTITVQGFDHRTPGHQGRVQLIAPFKVVSNRGYNLASVTRLELRFVPEPGTFALLAAATAGLALAGLRRVRRPRSRG